MAAFLPSTRLCNPAPIFRLMLSYLHQAKLLSLPPADFTFSHLLSLAAEAFPPLASAVGPQLEFVFRDEDGDAIVIDDDDSLQVLASLVSDLALIKLRVQPKLAEHNADSYARATAQDHKTQISNVATNRAHSSSVPCRHFNKGFCRLGSSCKFLHQTSFSRSPTLGGMKSKPMRDALDEVAWLKTQKYAPEHENISYLSSSEGYECLSRILSNPHLPREAIVLLIDILTRPKFRTSLIKQDTDKIYNALPGSQFLVLLHGHIRSNVRAMAQCIEPYALLCEEIMGRTSNGWWEVPLDELKGLVDELEDGSSSELRYRIMRLLEHRAKKKRMEAVNEQTGVLSLGFRSLPIIPAKEQLLDGQQLSPLPINKTGFRYPSVVSYLETHFKLLQEDCIATLRDGIHALRKNSREPNLHVYTDVQLVGIECGTESLVYRVSFNANARHIDEQSKRLMYGSLLCVSCDKFQTFMWAVVVNRTPELLTKHQVDIRILKDSSDMNTLEVNVIYMMAESAAAYFEAYSHVLLNLQRPEMDDLPFQEHLLSLEPHVREPLYLTGRNAGDVYNFGCAFPEMKHELNTAHFHILETWPTWSHCLDSSQMIALKHGLTKRLALIQGPPGTGKTFIGLLIVKILLQNLKADTSIRQNIRVLSLVEEKVRAPILIICYTNHALDQFLEGIYAYEKNIVRVGGRCKSSQLQNCNLHRIVPQTNPRLYHQYKEASREKEDLQKQISLCIDKMALQTATEASLHGVATEAHMRSLFYEGSRSNAVVDIWLNEREKTTQPKYDERQTLRDNEAITFNHFNTLTVDEEALGEPRKLRLWGINGQGKNLVAQSENRMKMIDQNENCDGNELTDPEWTAVKRRKPKAYKVPISNDYGSNADSENRDVEWTLEMLQNHNDVWSLNRHARMMLHAHWLNTVHLKAKEQMAMLSTKYQTVCKAKLEIEHEIQLSKLRTAKVVGMTTTAGARHHVILESLETEIIVVEEAAEVLESHILACLTSSTKHLILIGDHMQLRPSVAVHELAVRNQLDVSLFERLVKGGVEYVTLEVQRRMRPCISKLISSIYPMLKDHASVSSHENIQGVKSNVFFFNHAAPEEHRGDDESGKVNVEEAHLVVEFLNYLLKQGYTTEDITVLSMYKGQCQEILSRLRRKLQANFANWHEENQQTLPRVSSVDDYQGEECKIIILSLVRNNTIPTPHGPGKIGFLAVSNRVCVALSRARNGLFIFGNGGLLSKKSELWGRVVKQLQDSQCYGDSLVLTCQNHAQMETKIQKPADFTNVQDGGCSKPCEYQLSCGHVCPKRCHSGDHAKIVCPKRCPRKHPHCDHQCQSLCHGFEDCPPCKEPVRKQLPECGHFARVLCSTSIDSVRCAEPCPKVLACSHKCSNSCGTQCTTKCKHLVERVLPCGHSAKLHCHEDPLTFVCGQPCKQNLPDCHHTCQGTCGTCRQGTQHVRCRRQCGRTLPCGHACTSVCHRICPPCSLPCQKRCIHSRCPRKCGHPCVPCMEMCEWSCEHHTCKLLCHEVCRRPRCNEGCERLLSCGHPCLGLCGESCPPICRICTPDFKDTISQLMLEEFEEADRFMQLQECGHVFEVSGLDTWMEIEQSASGGNAVSLKKCPECRRQITNTFRYGNAVKAKLQQIEEVKMRILGFELINEGIWLLQNKEFDRAAEKFIAAIEQNEANFEAYFGLGNVLCLQSDYMHGIEFFRFVIKHSSLSSAVTELLPDQVKSSARLPLFSRDAKNEKKLLALVRRIALCSPTQQAEAAKELARQAVVQLATALSNMGKFDLSIKACEIVLEEDAGNRDAEETMRLATEGRRREVVAAMVQEVGGRGHWYQCPNGHYYVVGECGGPMQTSVCPDCKVKVGGENHRPAEGNRHANIDGSEYSAWSNRTGLGNANDWRL